MRFHVSDIAGIRGAILSVIEIFHQLFAVRAAYSSSFTRTSFISLISEITIA